MAIINSRNISLYEEAKTGLISLVQQTVLVGVSFLIMLLLTGGHPAPFVVYLSICLSLVFVVWSEKKRFKESRELYIPVGNAQGSQDDTTEEN